MDKISNLKYVCDCVYVCMCVILKDSKNSFKHILLVSPHLQSKALFHAVLSKEAIILHRILYLKGFSEPIFF